MRKQVFGRQFKRDIHERKALFKSLMSELVLRERIQTTEEKAKSIRPSVERLVTVVKKNGNRVADRMRGELFPNAIEKMITDIAPRFTNRPGGYTRIVRLPHRVTDGASQAIIEWVEPSSKLKVQSSKLEANSKKGKKETGSKEVKVKPAKKAAPKAEKKEPKKAAKKEVKK